MTYDFKEFSYEYGLTRMISVSLNAVYFSSSFRKDMNIKPDEYFSFAHDGKKGVIEVRRSDKTKNEAYRINSKGYCKLRLSSIVPQGHYIFQEKSDLGFIMKLKS